MQRVPFLGPYPQEFLENSAPPGRRFTLGDSAYHATISASRCFTSAGTTSSTV